MQVIPDISAPPRSHSERSLLRAFLPFWACIAAYKFAAVLHYSVLAPLGAMLLPLWVVGLLIGGESFFQMLLDVPAGHLVDRFGRKRMLAVGIIVFGFAGLLLFDFSLPAYIASIALSTIGWLFLAPGVNAYILTYAERETSGRFLALRDTFLSLGVVLASVVLPFVLLFPSPRWMGLTIVAILIVALFLLAKSPRDRALPNTTPIFPAQVYHIKRTFFIETLKALRRLNPASGMLFAYTLAGSIFYGVIWFTVPLIIATEPHREILGLGLGIFDLTIVVLGILIGTVVDKGNKRLLVFYGLFLFALAGMALGTSFGPLFLLFGFLATAGDETAGLSLWSWLHSLDKEHAHDGAVAGAISFAEDLGYTIGPILAGFVFLLIGPAWTIVIGALPLVAAWAAYSYFVNVPKLTLSLTGIPPMPMRRRHKA